MQRKKYLNSDIILKKNQNHQKKIMFFLIENYNDVNSTNRK